MSVMSSRSFNNYLTHSLHIGCLKGKFYLIKYQNDIEIIESQNNIK